MTLPPTGATPLLPADEARAVVLGHALKPRSISVALEDATGYVLARDIRADRDVPPFDRSTLDGYAIRVAYRGDGADGTAADAAHGDGQIVCDYPVVARIVAGSPWKKKIPQRSAVSITTGSPVPAGADVVVPVERTTSPEEGTVRIDPEYFASLRAAIEKGRAGGDRPGIAARATDSKKGDQVLRAGVRLRPQDVAVLAGVGAVRVPVRPRPDVEILATGDEVVEPHERPRWDQIRNSNGPLLRSLLGASGSVRSVGMRRVPDHPGKLVRRIEGAKANVLVFTGGVSMGERDFVPAALREAGFRIHIHRIAIRPGKPFLFATRGRGAATRVAFGLPGNPFSVLVTAWEFLLPFLRASAGASLPGPSWEVCIAGRGLERPAGLTHFVPIEVTGAGDGGFREVAPVGYHGSGDYVAMGRTQGVVVLPADATRVESGDRVLVHFFGREVE
ncbi:MAG: molybdopterin molybdotransferase MoeA [Candidatus Eisenbacteria bacterium]